MTRLSVTLSARQARFRNEVGLFVVDDAAGRIGRLRPGDRGYARVALAAGRRIPLFRPDQEAGSSATVELPAGSHVGFYLVQDSTAERFLEPRGKAGKGPRPRVHFSFPAANGDRLRHVLRQAGDVVAFEDRYGGGDRDYNDAVLTIRTTVVAPAPTPGPLPTDTAPPLVTLVEPAAGTLTNGPLALAGSAIDAGGGIRAVEARIDGGAPFAVAFDAAGAFRPPLDLAGQKVADGPHTIQVRATDRDGNASDWASRGFTYDASPPVLAAGPSSPASPANRAVTIPGTARDDGSGVVEVLARLGDAPAAPVPFDASSGAFTFAPALALDGSGDGPHTAQFRARDRAGNLSDWTPVSFVLDTLAPTVTIAEPSAALQTRANVAIKGRAADAGTGVSGLTARIDGGAEQAVEFDSLGEFTLTTPFALDGTSDGSHTVVFRATDRAGNASAPSEVRLILDATAPAVVIAAPDPGSLGRANVTVIGTVRDGLTGVELLEARLDGQAFGPATFDESGGFSFATTLALDGTADGGHTVTLRATDRVGNVSSPTTLSFTLDTTPPVLELGATVPASPSSRNVTVAGTVRDAVAGVEAVEARLDGGAAVPLTMDAATGGFSYTSTLALDGTADGSHTAEFRARDLAGNQGDWTPVTFVLDTVAPAATLLLDPASDVDVPGDDMTYLGRVRLIGQTEPGLLVTLPATGAVTRAGADGRFAFDDVPLAVGSNPLQVEATDAAGNVGRAARAVERCGFDDQLGGWTALERGGTDASRGSVAVQDGAAVLREGDSFTVGIAQSFTVTAGLKSIRIIYDDPAFDATAQGSIRDAFEAALVDESGAPLVHAFASGRDAFYNVGEGAAAALGRGAAFEGRTLVLDTSALFAGTDARLLLRLVNNDSDTGTSVRILCVDLSEAPATAGAAGSTAAPPAVPSATTAGPAPGATAAILASASPPAASLASPGIVIDAPAPDQVLAVGGTMVIAGHVEGGDLPLASVSIDGIPADAIDASGRFFARTTVAPGRTEFRIEAADSTGRPLQTSLTVQGVDAHPAIDFTRLSDVSASLSGVYGRTSFNEDASVLYADLAIRNGGTYAANRSLLLGITQISDPGVRVRGQAGTTPDGIPYYDFTPSLTDGRLEPGATSASQVVAFANPGRVRFTYELVVLGVLDRAPAFTTVPDVEALAGRPYAYDADAADPDGDPLSYALVGGPATMAIDPATGALSWSPSSTEVGTTDVVIEASDGRGGTATQRYTLSVVVPPPNRPPVFTSTPVVSANVIGPFSEVMYGASSDIHGTSRLIRVDGFGSTTPTVQTVGDLGVVVGDLAGTDSGILYAATFSGVYAVDTKKGELGTLVAPALKGNSLAWAPNNVLYSWSFDQSEVVSLDLNTNTTRTVTSLPDQGADLAWDPTEHMLYAVGLSNHLYRIDPTTGSFQDVGTIQIGGLTCSITIDRTGQLYTGGGFLASPAFNLYRTDKTNASTTLVEDFGASDLGLYGLGSVLIPEGSGIPYTYQAAATDPDGDSLSFSFLPPITVPITNPGFEDPVMDDGRFGVGSFTGWTVTGVAGPFNPGASVFPGGAAPEGQNVAFVDVGTLSQVLTTSLAVDTRYTLQVDVGDSLITTIPAFAVELWAGASFLASSSTPKPADGSFTTVTVEYQSTASSPGLGQPLQIRLRSHSVESYFDDVRLTAQPDVPPGMTMDPATGLVTWSPDVDQVGNHPVSIRVADGHGGTATQSFTINVQPPLSNHAPVFTSEPVHTITSAPSSTMTPVPGQAHLPGAVALYQADGNARDAIGGHDGTLSDGVSFAPSATNLGQAFAFHNSSQEVISVPESPDLDLTALTIDAWVRIDSLPGSADWCIVSKGVSGSVENYGLYIRRTGANSMELLFEYDDHGPQNGYWWLSSSGSGLTVGSFHHVAVTADGTTIRFYCDGRFISDTPQPLPLIPNARPLTIGSAQPSFGNNFDGLIDQLTIYNRALNDAEIQSLDFLVNPPTYTYQAAAIDPDADPLTFSILSGPEGMLIDPTSGLVRWRPSAAQSGPNPVTLRVSDGRGGFDEQSFTIDAVARPGEIHGSVFEDLNGNGSGDSKLLVASRDTDSVLRYDGRTGAFIDSLPIAHPEAITIDALGRVYASSRDSATTILRYNATAGGFTDTFATSPSGGDFDGAVFGPDGDLYAANYDLGSIQRFDGQTGQFIDDFVAGGLRYPAGLTFGPDGNLYVATFTSVERYDGKTGEYLGTFVDRGSGGIGRPTDVVFRGGYLYVSDYSNSSVYRYEASTGGFHDVFVSGGLGYAQYLAFGPDGNLYVSDLFGGITRCDGLTGQVLGVFVPRGSGELDGTSEMVFLGDPSLAGWTVYLDQNANGRRDPGEASTTTDADGNYAFTGLPAGTYFVREEPKPGWNQTTPGNAASLLLNGDFETTTFTALPDGRKRYLGWTEQFYLPSGFTGLALEAVDGISSFDTRDNRFDGPTSPAPDPFFPYQSEADPRLDHFAAVRPDGPAPTSVYNELKSDPFYVNGPITADVWRESEASVSRVMFYDADTDQALGTFQVTTPARAWTRVTFDTSAFLGRKCYIILHGGTSQAGAGWQTLFDNIFGGVSVKPTTIDVAQRVELAQGQVVTGIDFGNRPSSLDLAVGTVDGGALTFDGQLLTVAGTATAHVENRGTDGLDQPFNVLFFEDRDFDRKYTPNIDVVLGSTRVTTPIPGGQGIDVSAELSGTVLFAGSMIWAFVDSGQEIAESDEANNLANSCQSCSATPPPGEFDPVVEWNKDTFSVQPDSKQVMMTPLVIDVNQDRTPDVVFTTFTGGGYTRGGVLRAISGDDGRELWSTTSPYSLDPTASLAAGDIDGDGKPEIIGTTADQNLIAFHGDGTFLWLGGSVGYNYWGGASLADLNGDGTPEIIFGSRAFKSDGTLLWAGQGPGIGDGGQSGPLSVVADLDLDGVPEVLAGSTAYRADGSLYWNAPIPDGFVAVANFDSDPFPEVVEVCYGNLYLLAHDGTIRWGPVPIPGAARFGNSYYAGPPTVADMDGDGEPEIGVAGGSQYTVFETDGSVKWSQPTEDFSSSVTGSSVFDFEGDGKAEVVYGDEQYLWIYRGTDGAILYQLPRGSGTAYESPVIADVDADGNAEIIVAANDYYRIGTDLRLMSWGDGSGVPTSGKDLVIAGTDSDGLLHIRVFDAAGVLTDTFEAKDSRGLLHLKTADASGTVLSDEDEGSLTGAQVEAIGRLKQVLPGLLPPHVLSSDERNQVLSAVTPIVGHTLGITGILVIGDRNNTWAPTRPIWNQQTYHITNVNDDGTIPAHEANSWQIYNSYRLNTLPGFTGSRPAPDLVGSYVRIDEGIDSHTITARIGNVGSWFVGAGVSVAFYEGNPQDGGVLLGTARTTAKLEPGHYEDLTLTIPASTLTDVWVSVDDDGTGHGAVLECHENNNLYQSGTGLPSLNHLPVIVSTPVTDGIVGLPYRYDVDATDADPGDVLTYALRAEPQGMTIDPITGVITWTPLAGYESRRVIQVFVSDGHGGRAAQLFTIDVQSPNRRPAFTTSAPDGATSGQHYQYAAAAKDPDGDPLTFDLVVKPDGMAVQPATGTVVWTPTAEQVGTFYVVLRVQDGRGGLDLQAFTLTVTAANTPPVITSTPPGPTAGGASYEYRVKAQDADGDPVTFRLDVAPADMVIDPSTGVLRWPATQVGVAHVVVTADDGRGGQASQAFDLSVVDGLPNTSPVITSQPRAESRLGRVYVYAVIANDAEGDSLTFSLDAQPIGMAIDANGLLTWDPQPDQLGPNDVTVRVDDGRGGVAAQAFTINVSNTAANRDPVIVSRPGLAGLMGEAYRYDATAQDPDGDPIVWSLDTAPRGMSIAPQTGAIRWTPASGQLGAISVVVRATDTQGGASTQSFAIDVRAVNSPPNITSTPPTTAAVGQTYRYAVRAGDPDGDTLTFSLASSPDGMSIDAVTGLILWSPAEIQAGTQSVSIRVSDGRGGVGTQDLAVVVSVSTSDRPPTITSTPPYVAGVGQAYGYTVTGTDPEGQPLTFSLLAGPADMTIDAATGVVAWTPKPDQAGSMNVTVGAADPAGNVASQGFTVVVRPANRAPGVNSSPVATATAGLTYRYDVRASDPDNDPIAYRLDAAPAGMTIDDRGRITWKTDASQVGTVSIDLVVSDGRGGEAHQAFDLTVAADTDAPRVTLTASPDPVNVGATTLVVVTASDNVGVAGVILTFDGAPVVVDSSGKASVPAARVGAIPAVATVTDAAGNVGTASITVHVLDPSDVDAPEVALTSPADGATLTAPGDVIGRVTDANLREYTLSVAPVDTGVFTVIARGTASVPGGPLGKLDTSLLANDTYILRLWAVDANDHEASVERTVHVAGDLKLGNFTVSFTDLSIPVMGVPITLTRTYDTLQAARQDDFGHGWRLEFRDADLRTSVRPTGQEDDLIYNPFVAGVTKVYVQLPGGKREGFTFRPELAPGLRGSFLGIYYPRFVPDPGVTSTLTVRNIELNVYSDGSVGDYASGQAYNPSSPLFDARYVVTTQEGLAYAISGITGKLDSVSDANGNTLTFTDDGIVSSAGTGVTFERDPQGRITAVADPMGRKIRYAYDAAGNLVTVTDRADAVTRLEYRTDRPHYLDRIIDPLGRTGIRTDYDDDGRLIQVIDALGHEVRQSYDPTHSRVTITDQLGNPTTYEYDTLGNVVLQIDALGGETKYRYEDPANPTRETSVTDPLGRTTTTKYDARGNVLETTDPLGHVTRSTYRLIDWGTSLVARFGGMSFAPFSVEQTQTDPLGNTATNSYDQFGNLTETRDAAGKVTTFAYDAHGNPTALADAVGTRYTFEYDDAGHLTSQTDALGNVTVNTYDLYGNVKTESRTLTTPEGVRTLVTTTEYDNEGRVTKVTDAEGGVTETRYNAAGQRIASIDAKGRTTRYVYDDRGKLTRTILPDETPDAPDDNPFTATEYDAAGHAVATIDELGRRTTMHYDALGRLDLTIYPDDTPDNPDDTPRTGVEYDAAGRQKATIDERGNRTEYDYDDAGRQTVVRDALGHETTTTYDDSGRAVATTDANGHTTRMVYDASGRVIETDYADGTKTSTTYDDRGRVVARTDQLGRTTKYEYDDADRLRAVVDALQQRTTYDYDESGDLVTQTDANGHTTTYEYDGLGRRTATVLPLGQRSTMTYDPAGNVASTTDFNGRTITFDYDARNRLVAKHLPDATSVTFAYTADGQRQTVVDARGTTTYSYDARNHLLSRTDPDGTTISYTYDLAGNRTSVIIPAGTTTYTFDTLNRLATVTDPDRGVTTYTYDAVSDLIGTARPNTTAETRTYDALNRLLTIVDRGPDGSILESFTYTLAATGRRDAVLEQDGRTVSYTYDDLDRLTREAIENADGTTRTISYTYDPVGNRQTRTDSAEGATSYTYDDNDRLLTETLGSQTTQYTYDDNGNTRSKFTSVVDQALYEWDSENRMVGATVTDSVGTKHVVYQYDVGGIRVSSTVDDHQTRYLIDTVQSYAQVVEEYTPSGVIKVSYVYGNDLLSQRRDNARTFYQVDGLGSTRAMTNASGSITDRYVYDAFGQSIGQVGSTGNAYLFAGEQRDSATGLDYLRARYLSNAQGRFLSRDPYYEKIKSHNSINFYFYANNNPVGMVDPTGLFGISEFLETASGFGEWSVDFFGPLAGQALLRSFNEEQHKLVSQDIPKAIDIIDRVLDPSIIDQQRKEAWYFPSDQFDEVFSNYVRINELLHSMSSSDSEMYKIIGFDPIGIDRPNGAKSTAAYLAFSGKVALRKDYFTEPDVKERAGVLIHELAHVVLGQHTEWGETYYPDPNRYPSNGIENADSYREHALSYYR